MKNTCSITLSLLLALLLAGCSSMSGKKDDESSAEGAPVSEVDGGGAETSGAADGGAWTGNPLDNPESLLSTRVILFDFDIAEVREDYRDVVIAHGEFLANNPAVTVNIEGHADERGTREYNIGLGERRANTVKRLLMAQGAADSQISTVSYGEERPVALGSNEAAWAQNRRAEFIY